MSYKSKNLIEEFLEFPAKIKDSVTKYQNAQNLNLSSGLTLTSFILLVLLGVLSAKGIDIYLKKKSKIKLKKDSTQPSDLITKILKEPIARHSSPLLIGLFVTLILYLTVSEPSIDRMIIRIGLSIFILGITSIIIEWATSENSPAASIDGLIPDHVKPLRFRLGLLQISLIASFIANFGEQDTLKVLNGWINNLATKVFSSDTLALKAVQAGQCDATIVNSYYLGRLVASEQADNLNLIWANQDSTGVHVNVSGGGVIKYSRQKEEAIKLLEWLTSTWAQEKYANLNLEYPVAEGAPINPVMEAWGEFLEDKLNAKVLGELQQQAVLLAREANYQ